MKKIIITILILLLVAAGVFTYFNRDSFSVITGTPDEVCNIDLEIPCTTANDCWQVVRAEATNEEYQQWQDTVSLTCDGTCIAGDLTC